MRRFRLSLLLTAAAASIAWAQNAPPSEKDTPDLAARCSALTGAIDRIDPGQWSDARIRTLVQCDQSGPPRVALLWKAWPNIVTSVSIWELRSFTRGLADRRLVDPLSDVARDTGRPAPERQAAIDVLTGFALPDVAVSPILHGTAVDDSLTYFTLGGAPYRMRGMVPLPADLEQSTHDLVRKLAASDPIAEVKHYTSRLLVAWNADRTVRAMPQVDVNRISLSYICGNRFRVRNGNTIHVVLTFDAAGSANGPYEIQVGARPDPRARARDKEKDRAHGEDAPSAGEQGFATAEFDARAVGDVRLYLGGNLIRTAANRGRPCK